MSISRKNITSFVLFLLAITISKVIYSPDYQSVMELLIEFILYPLVVAFFLLYYSLKYFSWSFRKTFLVYFLIVFFAQVLDHVFFFLETGISIFNDVKTGAVGSGMLMLDMFVGSVVLFSNKEKFGPTY